jgi:ankyrin repeat protein
VKLLLEKGADVESKNDFGQTPLLLAAWNGHKAAVKPLFEKITPLEAGECSPSL